MLICLYKKKQIEVMCVTLKNIYCLFTTLHARLKLYDMIEQLENQNVYCDIDWMKYD